MSRHSKIQNLLYEYLRDELNSQDREIVERHLASCDRCSAQLKDVESALQTLDRLRADASGNRPQEFWNSFALRVEQRIQTRQPQKRFAVSSLEYLQSFFVFHRSLAVSLGGALVLAFLAIGIWNLSVDRERKTMHLSSVQEPSRSDSVREEMSRYFRKSKVLLVGLTNMKLPEDQQVDLSVERRASRELVQQARYLRNQPIDVRSARLIEDMERILIELANMKEENNMPNVEIVRAGIHQENLLFKIRMAETLYDTAQIVRVRDDF